MPRTAGLGQTLVLSAIVAVGIAAAWCFAAVWLITVIAGATGAVKTYEQLNVGVNGEPIIVRTSPGRFGEDTSLTLAGELSPISNQDLLYPRWLMAPVKARLPLGPPDWSSRVASTNDRGAPAIYWYLVHDGGLPGRAYGVGYHSKSKEVIGHFGRTGFTQSLPPREDWFTMSKARHGLSGAISAYGSYGAAEPINAVFDPVMPLLADDKLWMIDVAQRQVRPLLDCPTAIELGSVWKLPKEPPVAVAGIIPQPAQSTTPQHLFVRQTESVIVVNPSDGNFVTYPLPADLRQAMIAAYALADGRLLLLGAKTQGDHVQEVLWVNTDGGDIKRQQVRLANQTRSLSVAAMGWFSAASAPFPLASALSAGFASWGMVQQGETETYSAAASKWLTEAWPSMLVVLGIGIAAAVAAYLRQRRFGLPQAIPWAIFAFLFGVPGWLAYRFHRTWPVLEECPACRQASPRDREACTECGADFPPPPLKGIEVFA